MRKRLTILLALLCLTVSVGWAARNCLPKHGPKRMEAIAILSTVYPDSRSVLGEVYGTTDTDQALVPTPIGKSAMEDNRPPLLDDKKK